jgi:hypothetical protein
MFYRLTVGLVLGVLVLAGAGCSSHENDESMAPVQLGVDKPMPGPNKANAKVQVLKDFAAPAKR